MSAAPPVLRARGVRRRYSGRVVLDVDRLDIDSGEILALLGPNGAGKSTLFRLLLLLETPDEGSIEINGVHATRSSPAAARAVAGVFQKPFLFSGTVRSNIGIALREHTLDSSERRSRIEEALESLDLVRLADANVRTLSGGEAQRVALARALAVRPQILLLDEPTSALDVTLRARFREHLARVLRSRDQAALVITHDAADAYALADRVAVMQEGRIVQTGTPTEVALDPATPFVAAFTGAELTVEGRVEGIEESLATIRVAGDVRVLATVSAHVRISTGAACLVAYRPEDVALTRGGADTSAQNRIQARVRALVPAGGLVRVRLDGPWPMTALITRRAAEQMELAVDDVVTAQIKATALRAFPT